MNLLLLLILPLLTALSILLGGRGRSARYIALIGSSAQVLISLILFFAYRLQLRMHYPALQFEQRYEWFPAWNISFHIGVDGISVAMILLTAFVVVAGVLISWNVEKMAREFHFLLILLSLGAYGFFISLDLFLMFFFLEIAVIPKYLLIGIWGSGRKEYSANKLALMLMGGSALVLVAILGLYFTSHVHSFSLVELAQGNISPDIQRICYPLLFIGFGVFTAIFPFHTWVPDGHSSAPTAGSMFLAGISMKLGGYGCLKVATYLMPDAARQFAIPVIILSSIAILYGAFATMMQKDLKYLNAYSSISHCGFVLLGIGMLNATAISGAVMQMVSHGLMTALFFSIIGIVYERTHTRKLNEMGGLLKVMPFTITAMFIAGLCSLGLPGLSGFVAEMTIFVGGWQHPGMIYRLTTIIACMSIVVTAVYILRGITKVGMGQLPSQFETLEDARWNEKAAVILLVAGIFAIGVSPAWLSNLLQPSIDVIMHKLSVNP